MALAPLKMKTDKVHASEICADSPNESTNQNPVVPWLSSQNQVSRVTMATPIYGWDYPLLSFIQEDLIVAQMGNFYLGTSFLRRAVEDNSKGTRFPNRVCLRTLLVDFCSCWAFVGSALSPCATWEFAALEISKCIHSSSREHTHTHTHTLAVHTGETPFPPDTPTRTQRPMSNTTSGCHLPLDPVAVVDQTCRACKIYRPDCLACRAPKDQMQCQTMVARAAMSKVPGNQQRTILSH